MTQNLDKAAPTADAELAGAPEEEIEITPEMIAAGARIYIRESDDTEKEVVAKIYRAMECIRRASKK